MIREWSSGMRERVPQVAIPLVPSIAAQRAKSPLGAQTRKSVFQPATSRMSRNADLPVCAPNGHSPPFLPRSDASAPCFGAEIRTGLELCDVSRSTNTGLPPALRHRCRSLRRAMRPFVTERKTDEIHRLRHKPHRAVARGPRKVPSVLSMPYGQRRDTTAPRGWHIPIHARACA